MLLDNIPFLQGLPPELREFVVRLLLALLALLITFALRRLLTALIIRPFRRRAERTASTLDDQILNIFTAPVQWFILAAGILLAVTLLGVDRERDRVINPILNSVVIIAIAIACYRAVTIVSLSGQRLNDLIGVSIEERLVPFVRVALRFVIIILTTTIVLQAWGYNVDTLVAGLGIGSIGVSLAAQDTIGNLFGFASIVTDRPFVVGDTIEVGGDEGVIEHVGLRSSILRKSDQSRVIIPNGVLAKSTITNWSRLNKRQIEMTITLKAGVTSDQITKITRTLRDMFLSRPKIEPTSVTVLLSDVASASVKLHIVAYFFIRENMEFLREQDQINRRIMDILAGIVV
ncbi:MAG TPA: mechanosensitive ion channel family protein [Aggregatilineales bacterium]|nr:mechanosensitive ion channel family protein [Anaerolineales bacterium]HRE46317.1 mechanosensitive ion channel family protein [Aggregatilineales bacterium]